MAIPDMPNVPPQNVPVMIAQANQAQVGDVTTVRAIGVCHPASSNVYTLENVIDPIGEAGFYLRAYEHQKIQNIGTVTVLQQPKHGILRLVTEADNFGVGRFDPSNPGYAYLPEKGYLGKDKAVMLVEIGGVKVKVVYFFQAIGGSKGNDGVEVLCGKKGYHWKISSTLDPNGSTLTSVENQSPFANASITTAQWEPLKIHFSG